MSNWALAFAAFQTIFDIAICAALFAHLKWMKNTDAWQELNSDNIRKLYGYMGQSMWREKERKK